MSMFSSLRSLFLFTGLSLLVACQSSQPERYDPTSFFPPHPIGREYPAYSSQRTPPSSYLYPSGRQRDLRFLCTKLYSIADFSRKPFIRDSPPELAIVTEDTVTVYFANDNTQTFAKPNSVTLPRGTYRCR